MTKPKPGWPRLFLVWLGLFAGISFILWIAIEFWGRNLNLAPLPRIVSAPMARGLRVIPPLNNAPVMRLEEVTESNAQLSFVGRMVHFDNVRVTEVVGMTFFVASRGGKTLLVASSQEEPLAIRVGQRVNLQGLILNVPDTQTMERLWQVDPAQAARLQREQIYLRASTIEKV